MKVARIHSDGKGESHFDDVEISFSPTHFIEGAQPIGRAEIMASDGEARGFEKGDVVLLEDVSGAGHGTHFVSDEESLVLLIRLA